MSMDTPRPLFLNRATAWLVAVALWACMFLPGLGTLEIQGNESKRIMPALHMIESGGWLTPQIGGVTYVNKPPLIYWMVAGSFLITGSRGELSARLPSVVTILLFVSLLILMPSSLLSVAARLGAATVFMTSVSFIEKGRLIEIEASFVSVTGMAVLWWLNAWADQRNRWAVWLVPCFMLGVGLLLKGPLILLFFYAVVLIVLSYTRRLKDALAFPHLAGIVLMASMFLWWVLYIVHTSATAKAGLQSEVGARFAPAVINYAEWLGTWFKVLIDFLPWALLVPWLWNRAALTAIPEAHRPVFKACRLALVVCYVCVNAMPATRSRYSMPLFPLAAVLLGWLLAAQGGRSLLHTIWRRLVLIVFPAIACVAIICALLIPTGLLYALVERCNGPRLTASTTACQHIMAAITCIGACGATAVALRHRHRLYNLVNLAVATGVAFAVVMVGFAAFCLPILTQFEIRRPVGVAINNVVPRGASLYIYHVVYEPFLYYVYRPLVPLGTNDPPAAVHWLLAPNESLPTMSRRPWFSAAHTALEFTYKKQTYALYRLNGAERKE